VICPIEPKARAPTASCQLVPIKVLVRTLRDDMGPSGALVLATPRAFAPAPAPAPPLADTG